MKNRIKVLRAELNISQDDLSKAVDVSRQTINAIENGKFNPSVKLGIKISKIFNCSVEDVFQLEENEK